MIQFSRLSGVVVRQRGLALALSTAAASGIVGRCELAWAQLHASVPVTVSGPVASLAACGLNGDDNTPLIAADPADASRLVVTYLTGDDRAIVAARSQDGGATWSREALPGQTPCGQGDAWIDPGLMFAPGEQVVAGAGWTDRSATPGTRDHAAVREYIYHSADSGQHYEPPIDIEPTQPDQRSAFARLPDGTFLLETERIHYIGPTYSYAEPNGLVILRSGDGGASWSPIGQVPNTPGHVLQAAGLLIAPDSSVVAIADDVDLSTNAMPIARNLLLSDGAPMPTTVEAIRSTDGGRSFAQPVQIATCGNCLLPTATVAPEGALLVAFNDAHADGSADTDLARSTDGGQTWTMHRITHDPYGADNITVAARPGEIGVLATQGKAGPGQPVDAVLWTSQDNAATWTSLVLGGPYDKASITYQHWDGQLGPEQGLTALPDGYGATFTTLAPTPLADGEQDVVYVHATCHNKSVRPTPAQTPASMS